MSASSSWRSYLLVAALAFGVVFSLLYAAPLFGREGHAHADIPIQPRISQLEAIEIIEKDLRSEVPELQGAKLLYHFYNYSMQVESSPGYGRYLASIGYGYTFDHIKKNPGFLQLPLRFVHANGTVYNIDEFAGSPEKICDEPSVTCPMGRFGIYAKDRLVYNAEVRWEPATEEIWFNEGFYVIDAESGQIVWNSIDHERNRKPMPSVNFDNKTIAQLLKERLSPPETARVVIASGASNPENIEGYQPANSRVTLGIDNRIVWINSDDVPHTVVSDTGYDNSYTGKFESDILVPDSEFEYTFFEIGNYSYHCKLHPWMKGTVEIVENFT